MNTLELLTLMYQDLGMRARAGGVWPADALLHLHWERPSFMIVNSSESQEVGQYISLNWDQRNFVIL
jgi:hypothetical protein